MTGSPTLRIGTWNCRMGLDRKHDAVGRLAADVLVVPECSSGNALATRPAVSSVWCGDWPLKGFGVFGFNGWRVTQVVEDDPLPWALPVDVSYDGQVAVTLVAVWTSRPRLNGRPGYAAQVGKVIDRWEGGLAAGRVAIAGDLNCSAQGPSVAAHAENVRRLAALDVHSAYHWFTGLEHGLEKDMTLRWIGPGRRVYAYHCDFVFLPTRLLAGVNDVTVGSTKEWIECGLSDHTPVVVDVATL